jgi:hypothetical protein
MARLIRLLLGLALVTAIAFAVSWAVALHRVDVLLGDPPPSMGTHATTFLWDGMPQMEGHPRVWLFAFGPTVIPGARNVRIYVTPLGRVALTEPPDLAARVKVFHSTGY